MQKIEKRKQSYIKRRGTDMKSHNYTFSRFSISGENRIEKIQITRSIFY
jgi:hypothetical protein